MHAPYYNEKEMALEKGPAGHLGSFWRQLQLLPYKPDSSHELLEEVEEEAEAMQVLEVQLSLPDLDPTLYEPQVPFHNESLIY